MCSLGGRKDTWNNKDIDLEALSYRKVMSVRLGLHPTSIMRETVFLAMEGYPPTLLFFVFLNSFRLFL